MLQGATNLPWELDLAMLRRLEKRIFVPLPDMGARLKILENLLGPRNLSPDVSLEHLANKTDGYSGADVFLVAKEAAMRPLRRLMSQLELSAPSLPAITRGGNVQQIVKPGLPDIGPIESEDINAALSVTKPSARQFQKQYEEFGS